MSTNGKNRILSLADAANGGKRVPQFVTRGEWRALLQMLQERDTVFARLLDAHEAKLRALGAPEVLMVDSPSSPDSSDAAP